MALLGQKRPARKPTRREKEVASRGTRNASDADSQWLTVNRLAHDGRGIAHDGGGRAGAGGAPRTADRAAGGCRGRGSASDRDCTHGVARRCNRAAST